MIWPTDKPMSAATAQKLIAAFDVLHAYCLGKRIGVDGSSHCIDAYAAIDAEIQQHLAQATTIRLDSGYMGYQVLHENIPKRPTPNSSNSPYDGKWNAHEIDHQCSPSFAMNKPNDETWNAEFLQSLKTKEALYKSVDKLTKDVENLMSRMQENESVRFYQRSMIDKLELDIEGLKKIVYLKYPKLEVIPNGNFSDPND